MLSILLVFCKWNNEHAPFKFSEIRGLKLRQLHNGESHETFEIHWTNNITRFHVFLYFFSAFFSGYLNHWLGQINPFTIHVNCI
jgi:hypothetical protein